MTEKENQTLKVIAEECESIRYGRWKIELVIAQGRPVGYRQLESPQKEFKERQEKT